MKPRLLLSLALAFVLVVMIGCKDSKKTAQSEPAPQTQKPVQPPATPTPANPVTAVVKAMPHAAPPPLDTMVPTKTFQLKPPASFSSDQVSPGNAVEFMVEGDADRFLVVD